MVVVHHRTRPRRTPHLRLHPPRPEDDDAVSLDDEDRGSAPLRAVGTMATAADVRACGVAAAGRSVLGTARRAGYRDDDRADARRLSAVRTGDARVERDGHAGPARHV